MTTPVQFHVHVFGLVSWQIASWSYRWALVSDLLVFYCFISMFFHCFKCFFVYFSVNVSNFTVRRYASAVLAVIMCLSV